MNVRIISVDAHKQTYREGQDLNPVEAGPCSPMHSKFVKRREHVEHKLLPQLRALNAFEGVEIYEAITSNHFKVKSGYAFYGDIRVPQGSHGCIGNFLSNMVLWKFCVDSGKPLMILEDDALLPEGKAPVVLEAIAQFETMPDYCDILYLLSCSPSIENSYRSYADFDKVTASLLKLRTCYDLSGTAAYCVRPSSAAKLLERAYEKGTDATDSFIHRAFWENKIGVVVPVKYQDCFMLNENWASWNHIHDPNA